MQTQLLVKVKNANPVTKMYSSLLWFVEMAKKSRIEVYIDDVNGQPIELVARDEPYAIPLAPGQHVIYFVDPKAGRRSQLVSLGKNLTFGVFSSGVAAGMGSGLGGSLAAGALATAGGKRAEVRDNVLACELYQGDEIAVTVKPLWKKVKVEIGN